MNQQEVKQFFVEEMKTKINSVISGDTLKEQLYYMRPNDIIVYLKSIGFSETIPIHTNGWECDYWICYDNGDLYLMIAGDLYFLNYANVYLIDKEEVDGY